MRLSSPASLKGLKVSPAIKAQIEREFKAQEQAKGKSPSAVASQLSREQLKAVMPQEILSRQLEADPRTRVYEWAWDFVGAVPGRMFEIDCALVDHRLAIEIDGWPWQAKKRLQSGQRERLFAQPAGLGGVTGACRVGLQGLSRRDRTRCGVLNYLGTAPASRTEQWTKKHS